MSVTDTIINSHELTDDELTTLSREVERHPYFHAAALTLTLAHYNRQSAQYGDTLRRTAISIPDRTALFALIEGHDYKLDTVGKNGRRQSPTPNSQSSTGDRTTSLIDHFLDTLPEEKPRRLTIADAASDYMSYLMQHETPATTSDSPMRGQSLIDDFIGSNTQGERIMLGTQEDEAPTVKEANRRTPPIDTTSQDTNLDDEELAPEYFTETMARIYIKQGKFEKAMKIIARLNAKYPKKNRYFADQIRFLNKLLLNQSKKTE